MGEVRIVMLYNGEWVSDSNNKFQFIDAKSKGLAISSKVTYRELLAKVFDIVNVTEQEFTITMRFLYNAHVSVPPVEIANDDDVKFFVGENSGDASMRTPLCITLERIPRRVFSSTV